MVGRVPERLESTSPETAAFVGWLNDLRDAVMANSLDRGEFQITTKGAKLIKKRGSGDGTGGDSGDSRWQ